MKTFSQFTITETIEKQTCPRCGGSGKYSFNLMHGSMCYGCKGTGYVMVDKAAQAKNKLAKEKRQEQQKAIQAKTKAAYDSIADEMNKIHGPFDLTTELGHHQLNQAVYKQHGKDIYRLRDERMKNQSKT